MWIKVVTSVEYEEIKESIDKKNVD